MRKHQSSHRSANGKNFIILPIIFSVLILGISCAVVLPSASTFITLSQMFFSDGNKDFSTDYTNIFVPVADEPEESSTVEEQPAPEPKTVPISSITYPKSGEQFGELIIEDCQIDDKLFFGDSNVELNNGVGLYTGSFIPGYGKTILIAGHNNTYFNGLKYAEIGQKVKIRTSYGNYTYEITDIQVKYYNDESAYDLTAETENLIMYTCYPFDELGLTPKRCFVYGKLVSGPQIDKNS